MVKAVLLQVLGKVFAKHHNLALRIMLTLDRDLRAFPLLVMNELATWHFELAKLAFDQDKLTIMSEMVF